MPATITETAVSTTSIRVSGYRPRECAGKFLGQRNGQRLYLLIDPYDWGHESSQKSRYLAVVREENWAYRIWHPTKAPKWAQKMLAVTHSLTWPFLEN